MNIDSTSWKILNIVQQDGRISLKSLAAEIGLSLPATSERLKRLEEAGVINGYRANVAPDAVGYNVMALIGMTTQKSHKSQLMKALNEMPEVIECLHVTGQDSFIIRVVVRDIQHLEDFTGSINDYGETRTSIVLSHPIRMRSINPSLPTKELFT